MNEEYIISTAGLTMDESRRVRCYCSLMQSRLNHRWLVTDEFEYSHVCIVRDDYLNNVQSKINQMSQIQVVLNHSADENPYYKYQISTPLTGRKILNLLNQISDSESLTSIGKDRSSEKRSQGFVSGLFKCLKDKIFDTGHFINPLNKSKRKNIAGVIRSTFDSVNQLPYKIVLFGSPGSGKTTSVKTVSDNHLLTSEVSATDSVAAEKKQTTVGVDFAEIVIPETGNQPSVPMRIYGTPGQIHFNYIWNIVGKDADAYVVLLDMSRPEPMSYLKFYHDFIISKFEHKDIYCVLTHGDKYQSDLYLFRQKVTNKYHDIKKIYQFDARKKNEVMKCFWEINKSFNLMKLTK